MLTSLEIENIAVIERSEITFDKGFNILTGETGAGKSIIIDAINAVLGERTSREIVRRGCDRGRVTALFDEIPESVLPILEQYDVESTEDGLLVSRIITADGRSSCKINGTTVTVSVLREIGRNLISICGQNDSQLLLDKEHHLAFVDSISDSEELLENYKEAYSKLVACKKKLRKLIRNENDKELRLDMLRYQIDEITKADIKVGEKEELLKKRSSIRNIEKIVSGITQSLNLLNGYDDRNGIVSDLQSLSKHLDELTDYNETIARISAEISNMLYTVIDYTDELGRCLGNVEARDRSIDDIEERLDVIYRLTKKYGSEEEILGYLEKITEEYQSIFNNEEEMEKLQNEMYFLEDELFKQGCYLSDARKSASLDFENKVRRELTYLDMPDVQFIVDFKDGQATENGMDDVEFLFSANAGQEPKSLQKIASGGELSRVMLAIRCVLSDSDSLSTTIFDEIDTGVSGRAAHKIAYKMHELSNFKQVICVTHLAQIAAYADNHLYIEKVSDGIATHTMVSSLDKEGRINELARIIGGEVITASTLDSARELIEYAEKEGY